MNHPYPSYFIIRTRLIHFDPGQGPTFDYEVVASSEGDEGHARAVMEGLKRNDSKGIYLIVKNIS